MINALKYYYNITPQEIHQKDDKYRFNINNQRFILYPYKRSEEELAEIYKLQKYLEYIGMYCHKIIPNKEGQILTYINKIPYILLNVKIENRIITINDILNMSNITVDEREYKKIKRANWSKLWSEKIDYIENQIEQIGNKYPLIRESIDYNIGIVENCIQMLNNEISNIKTNTISHNRINKNITTEEFYNPINFIIDNKIRNIGEYLKTIMIEESNLIPLIEQTIYNNKLNNDEIKLLFIRTIYPSTYFDKYEKIIEKKLPEKDLESEIKNIEIKEQIINTIYNYLKTIINMPDIEWLKRKDVIQH